MGDDGTYDIEELAAAAGMTARNVRAYRTRGLLPEPLRRGRTARYDDTHLAQLREVQRLRAAGIPLRLITEAARRGADLGPEGRLGLLASEQIGARPKTVDVRDDPTGAAERRVLHLDQVTGDRTWAPLDEELVRELTGDARLHDRLRALGVVDGNGGLLYCSSDVSSALRAVTDCGMAGATALALVLQAAEAAGALAATIGDAVTEAGHSLSPALQDLVVRLTVGITRDTLTKEFETVG